MACSLSSFSRKVWWQPPQSLRPICWNCARRRPALRGVGQDELERAGAYRMYEEPRDLLKHLDEVGVRR